MNMDNYNAWRSNFQNSEQAAQAAYQAYVECRTLLDATRSERGGGALHKANMDYRAVHNSNKERIATLEAHIDRIKAAWGPLSKDVAMLFGQQPKHPEDGSCVVDGQSACEFAALLHSGPSPEALAIRLSEARVEAEQGRVEAEEQAQALAAHIEALRNALTGIAYPVSMLQRDAKASGDRIDGRAARELASDPEWLKALAVAALAAPVGTHLLAVRDLHQRADELERASQQMINGTDTFCLQSRAAKLRNQAREAAQ